MVPARRSVLNCVGVAFLSGLIGFAATGTVCARTIIEEWQAVKPPSPPELKEVTIDPRTTALLLLDFGKRNCGARQRCLASIPVIEKLAREARAKGVLVVHTLFGQATKADIIDTVAPKDGEPFVVSGANKFLRTDLEKILRDKGVTTVIATGTAAHGAVLNTAAAAALLGFKVIVPVDAVSAETAYPEQYTAWHLANAPGGIAPQVTITKADMIKF